jgi:hypothetical protein
MLAIIHRTRVAGILEATRGEFTKRVWIENGYVVHASSSDLVDSLGGFLRRSGRLTEEQLEQAMQRRAETVNRRLGELLIELGFLSPAEIYRAIREHAEGIVWSLFSWESGSVTFRIGIPELVEIVRIQIPLRQVILQGVKRVGNAKALVAKLGGRDAVYEPCFRFEDLIEVALDGQEYGLLATVDGRRTLLELCSEGPLPPADAARLLYAYHVLGLIRKSAQTAGQGGGGIKKIKLRSDS